MKKMAIASEIGEITGFWLGSFGIFNLIIVRKQHWFELPVLLLVSLSLLPISKSIKVLHTTLLRLIIAILPGVRIHSWVSSNDRAYVVKAKILLRVASKCPDLWPCRLLGECLRLVSLALEVCFLLGLILPLWLIQIWFVFLLIIIFSSHV